MFTTILNPEINDEEFDRLFDASWESMKAHFDQPKEAIYKGHYKNLKRYDTKIGVYDDGYLVTLLCGHSVEGTLVYKVAYFGQDINGSRAYAYGDEWGAALDKAMADNFNSYHVTTHESSAIDVYTETMQPKAVSTRGAALDSGTQTVAGQKFNGLKYNTVDN